MNDDIISRSGAVALILSGKVGDDSLFECPAECNSFLEWAAEEIRKMPSAQPEIIRCKDCEFYTEEERWCRRLGLCGAFDQDGYCSHAERKEE